MMLQIPVSAQVSADLVHRIDLGGQMVTMRFEWNTRAGAWFLHISDDLGNTMLGVKLVPNWPIFKHYRNAKPITGDIILLPVDDSVNWPPTYDEMGVKWFPFWIDEENANTWKQTQARAVPYIPTHKDAPVYPPPTLASVAPNIVTHPGPLSCVLTGDSFVAGCQVFFGPAGADPLVSGLAATNVVIVSPTQITCTPPNQDAGLVSVRVQNGAGEASVLDDAFTYVDGLFIDPRDGQVYTTATIGGRVWFTENLRGAFGTAKAYNNDEANVPTFGRVYNGLDAAAYAPPGWHLPTKAEWDALVALGGGQTTAGGKLKANSALWTPNTGTDDFGFAGLPAGQYSVSFGWNYLHTNATFWASDILIANSQWDYWLNGSNAFVSTGQSDRTRFWLSVRYIKD